MAGAATSSKGGPAAVEEARRRLLGPQKLLLERSAYAIRDAIDRSIRIHPAVDSRWARWAYRLRIGSVGSLLPWVAIWGMIILTFFEAPTWCLREPDACRPGTDLSPLYPRVTPRFLPRAWAIGLEFAALTVLLADYCLQAFAEGAVFIICHPWRRGFWHQLLLGVAFLSLLLTACFPTAVASRGGPFLRLLFLVVYSPRLRQEAALTLRILPQFGKALVLLLVVLLLYAILGLSIFTPSSDDPADAQEASIYFKDFGTAFASTWQLFLYWTFPSIMVLRDPDGGRADFLEPNWIQCLFVFSFMLLCIYILLNLGLAIVCDVYTERNEAVEKRRESERQISLERAFALLQTAATAADGGGDDALAAEADDDAAAGAAAAAAGEEDKGVPTYLVEAVLKLVGTFSSSAPRLTRRGVAAVIEDLDPEQDGFVSKGAFMNIPGLLFSSHERHNHSEDASPRQRPPRQPMAPPHGQQGQQQEEEGKMEEQRQQQRGYSHRRLRFVDLWCPRLSRSRGFRALERCVRGPYLEWFIDFVILANVALALASHGSSEKGILSQQDFTYATAIFFTIECAAKISVFGFHRYWSSYMNRFDSLLTLLSVLGAFYELCGSASSARHHTLLFFEFLRILRLFRVMLNVPWLRTTASTFISILPMASSLLLNLFAVTFAFASVGLESYGGLINKDPAQPQYDTLKDSYYYKNGLYIFNWNDLGGNFIVLVEILIDSSLIQPFSDALAAVKPTRKPLITLYMVLYYLVGQLIVLNVAVAFILDSFMDASANAKETEKNEKEEAAAAAAATTAAAAGASAAGSGSSSSSSGEGRGTEGTVPLLLLGAEDEEEEEEEEERGAGARRRALPVAPSGPGGSSVA